jgi:carbon monoxide dehydrogenase subunit G
VKITHEFTVASPPDTVWAFFQDVPAVSQCLPGAELLEDKGDGVYSGKVSVKLGPMTATFEGEAKVTPNPAERSGTIEGKGVDRRGGSRGQVKVEYRLTPENGGTRVVIDADVILSGAAAQFGRTGLINEMSNRLIGEFVDCVEGKLTAETPEEAAQVKAAEVRGFTLLLRSLWAWLRRLIGRR